MLVWIFVVEIIFPVPRYKVHLFHLTYPSIDGNRRRVRSLAALVDHLGLDETIDRIVNSTSYLLLLLSLHKYMP